MINIVVVVIYIYNNF